MALKALLLSLLLPGLGHVYVARPVKGAILASAFAALLFVAVLRGIAAPVAFLDDAFLIGLFGSAAVWLGTAWVMLRRVLAPLLSAVRLDKEGVFKKGLASYLRDDLDRAEREFRRVIDIDPGDVEANLQLAMVYKSKGRPRLARRCLKRCRRLDVDGKGQWEVRQELADL